MLYIIKDTFEISYSTPEFFDFTLVANDCAAGTFSFNLRLTKETMDKVCINYWMYINKEVQGIIETVSIDLKKKLLRVSGVTSMTFLQWRPVGRCEISDQLGINHWNPGIALHLPYDMAETIRDSLYSSYINWALNPNIEPQTAESRDLPRLTTRLAPSRFPDSRMEEEYVYEATGLEISRTECRNRQLLEVIADWIYTTGWKFEFYLKPDLANSANSKIHWTLKPWESAVELSTLEDNIQDLSMTTSWKDYWNSSVLAFDKVMCYNSYWPETQTGVNEFRYWYGHIWNWTPYKGHDFINSPLNYRIKGGMGSTDVMAKNDTMQSPPVFENFLDYYYGGSGNTEGTGGASQKMSANAASVLSRHSTDSTEFTYVGPKNIELGATVNLKVIDNELEINTTLQKRCTSIKYMVFADGAGGEDIVKMYTIQ